MMNKVVCGAVEGCPEHLKKNCHHAKPHKHYDLHGCGNVVCNRRGPITPEDWKKIGKGELPETERSCACKEVK